MISDNKQTGKKNHKSRMKELSNIFGYLVKENDWET